MRVDYIQNQNYSVFAFEGARARKLIEKVENAKRLNRLKISFEELKGMYKEIGYDVFYKRGSHAVVHLTDTVNLPLVIPHKTKNMCAMDLKRFKYVLAGEIEKAINC